jgi:hypothetical protein
MKPKLGVERRTWKFFKVTGKFMPTEKLKMFYTGGGSYQFFGFPDLHRVFKHYYFYRWCYLTIITIQETSMLQDKRKK